MAYIKGEIFAKNMDTNIDIVFKIPVYKDIWEKKE
jgi:hypothetical protein